MRERTNMTTSQSMGGESGLTLRAIDPRLAGPPGTPRSTDSANTKSEYRRLKAHNGPDLNRITAVMAYLTAAGLNFGRYAVVTAVI